MNSILQNVRYLPHDLKFYSLEDLRYQAKLYLKRSNNIPMSVPNYRTPNEQRFYLEKKLTQLS